MGHLKYRSISYAYICLYICLYIMLINFVIIKIRSLLSTAEKKDVSVQYILTEYLLWVLPSTEQIIHT